MPIKESICRQRLAAASIDITRFYKEDLLIYKGRTSDSKKLYNEVAAAFIYRNIAQFKEIETIDKKHTYITDKYKKFDVNQSNYNTQKQMILKLYNQRDFAVGKIVDCQTPLSDYFLYNQLDRAELLLSTSADELFILNVKLKASEQSLLRHIVELITIYQRLNHRKLVQELDLKKQTKVRFAPLIFKDSVPYKELSENRIWLYRLMSVLDLDIFVLEENTNGKYDISRHYFKDFANNEVKENL